MICVHCGKEIDNGQAFCPYCGSRVGGDAAPEAKAAKKDPRKLALPVAAVALLAVVGVGLANRMPSIDLQRYVTITAQGYDWKRSPLSMRKATAAPPTAPLPMPAVKP